MSCGRGARWGCGRGVVGMGGRLGGRDLRGMVNVEGMLEGCLRDVGGMGEGSWRDVGGVLEECLSTGNIITSLAEYGGSISE